MATPASTCACIWRRRGACRALPSTLPRASRAPGSADLEVRDTGQGMPESVRARIFEPFYSTKGAKGSGLGLAVAYSIISRRGGEISVESELGHGTTFTLRLPYVPSPA